MRLLCRNCFLKRFKYCSYNNEFFQRSLNRNSVFSSSVLFSRLHSSSSSPSSEKIASSEGQRKTQSPLEQGDTSIQRNYSKFCLDLVKKHEYESFLCALLLKGVDIRSFVFAIRSFNVEIALIRDQVSQKDIGLGRLTFWRDAVNRLFQNKNLRHDAQLDLPRHPVVLELSRVLRNKNVSKKWFVNLMEARERVMNDVAFKDIEDLETYSDKSVSPLLYLSFEALDVKSVDVDHACSHLGKAIGLANFIRSIPYNAQRRRVLIPQELLAKHSLSQENFIRSTNTEKISDAVFDIASQAHVHYKKASALKKNIPKEGLPLTLIGAPTDIYLKRLQRVHFNPYDASLNRRYTLLPLHLYYRKFTGSYY